LQKPKNIETPSPTPLQAPALPLAWLALLVGKICLCKRPLFKRFYPLSCYFATYLAIFFFYTILLTWF
jgi:hypothetical protein